MNVSYTDPFQRAWARMVRMLFRPFRLENWLALGLVTFLAELGGGGGGGGGYNWGARSRGGSIDTTVPRRVFDSAVEHLKEPFWVTVLSIGLVVLIVIAIVLTWLSCRARFVLVDDLVHERAAVVEPWHRLRRLGNSLFGFWIVFGLVTLALIAAASMPVWPWIADVFHGEKPAFHPAPLITMLAFLSPVLFGALLIALFANSFVVPIMYRQNITTMKAWGKFFDLFGRHPGSFVLFVLSMIAIVLVFITAVLLAGFATCCVGFVLFAIPYVGSVILLPGFLVIRGYPLEFLAQFGDDVNVFQGPPPVVG